MSRSDIGSDFRFIFAIGSAIVIGPASLAIFMPAVPAIRAEFGIDLQEAQLSLTLPLLAILLTPLIVGRMVDLLGRRQVLMVCIGLVILGCVLAMTTQHYWLLITGRVLVGVFTSACMIIGRAIVGDVYAGPALARMAARFTIPPVVAIMFAPLVGSFIIDMAGWRETFALVLVFSVFLLFVLWIYLPETLHLTSNPDTDEQVSRAPIDIRLILKSLTLWGYFLQSSFHFAVAFAFAGVAPHVIVTILGYDTAYYAFGLLTVVLGLLAGIVVAERISTRVSYALMVLAASSLGMIASLLATFLMFSLELELNPITLFVPAISVAFFIGLAMPYSQAGIVSTVETQAGTASGISTAMQMLFAAGFTHLLATTWLPPHLTISSFSALAMTAAALFALLPLLPRLQADGADKRRWSTQ